MGDIRRDRTRYKIRNRHQSEENVTNIDLKKKSQSLYEDTKAHTFLQSFSGVSK